MIGQRTYEEPPLLTAALTAFNAEDSIEAAVQSALAQTWRPLEVLVVDDGSSDSTPDILYRLEREHPEVRVVLHDHNRGTAAARNTLIAHAQGVALAFFDDDDTSMPERIRSQWERLQRFEREHGTTRPVLCHVSRSTTDTRGRTAYRRALGSNLSNAPPAGPVLLAHLLWGGPLPRADRGVTGTGGQMGRLEVYRSLGGFDERFRRAEDRELDVRVAREGGALIGLAEPLLQQRMTDTCDKSVEQVLPMQLQLLTVHREAFPNKALYVATQRWWEAWHLMRSGETLFAARKLLSAAILAPRTISRRLWTEVTDRLLRLHGRGRRWA